MDYVRVVYKRRYIVLPVLLVVFITGSVNTMRETPVYQSRLQMLIEPDTPAVARLDQMFQDPGGMDGEFMQTQFRILRSRSLARRTITELNLWDAPRLGNGPVPRARFSVMDLVNQGIRGVLSFASGVTAPRPVEQTATGLTAEEQQRADETARESGRIDQFLGGLSLAPVATSRIVEVIYTSTDPEFAARAANAVAKAYVEQNMESRFSASKEAADWLKDRLTEYRRALEQSEAALQAFRETNGAVSMTDAASNVVVQRLSDLNGALTKAKTERINKQALHDQLVAAEAAGNLDTFPTIMANDAIQRIKGELSDLQRQLAILSQRYGERNAEIIKLRSGIANNEAKLKVELSKVVDSVGNEYRSALSAEENLEGAFNQQKSEALNLNRKDIQFGVLQRDVESNKQIYESLMLRTKETGISSELRASNVRIVDPAEVPRGPISPNIQRGVQVAFGTGLILALGLAFGLEYLDSRIKTPEHVRNLLRLPFLGLVPEIRPRDLKGEAPLMYNDVPAPFAEAVRSLRTGLLFSSAEEGCKTLVVTSTGPGEGKTLIASNVAISLAQAGLRVILIDADMRRPRVHQLFAEKLEPGVSNLMVGQADQSAAIRSTRIPTLRLLTAGHAAPNPSELLSSAHFKTVIAKLREQYDWIVLDSPPVMAVTDACILAHDATGVLFVVGSEMTASGTAQVALDQLEAANAHFVGAVLNRAQIRRHAYYYSHYNTGKYADHYASKSAES